MNKSEALHVIAQQAHSGNLIFPTNLQGTLKIQQALNDPNCSLEHAAKLCLTEPLLATRIIAIANSVAYSRFGGGVTNVRTAVTILGFTTLRSVVAAVAVKQMHSAVKMPVLRDKAAQLWEHSCHVAALGYLIAKRVSLIDPDAALFAGIVHEIGGFYLISRAEEFPSLLEADPVDELASQNQHNEIMIGAAVLRTLLVPKNIVAVIKTLWTGNAQIPPETLADTVVLANALIELRSPFDSGKTPTLSLTDPTLDFKVHGRCFAEILNSAEEEITSLRSSLLA